MRGVIRLFGTILLSRFEREWGDATIYIPALIYSLR
jgi:hypothetical protein